MFTYLLSYLAYFPCRLKSWRSISFTNWRICGMIYVTEYVICRLSWFSGGISAISSICGWTLNRQINCFVQFAQLVLLDYCASLYLCSLCWARTVGVSFALKKKKKKRHKRTRFALMTVCFVEFAQLVLSQGHNLESLLVLAWRCVCVCVEGVGGGGEQDLSRIV